MNYKEKLNQVSTFIFDIDGVLTDGSIFLLTDQVVRVLNSRDGFALQYAKKQGYTIFVISGGSSESVRNRLLKTGVTEVFLRTHNKLKKYEEIKSEYKLSDQEILYMGDDIPDYEVMKQVGVSSCPFDAAVEIKRLVDYVSPFQGGHHAVRDVIEQTLRVQGKWFKGE